MLINNIKNFMINLMKNDPAWEQLFHAHGWPFTADHIAKMSENDFQQALLNTSLSVNRSIPGFEDFAVDSNTMVTSGSLCHSLLYHACASPNVTEINGTELTMFPAWRDLDVMENYIFSLESLTIDAIAEKARKLLQISSNVALELAVVVYAVEYRPGADTPHKKHADICLSRTGISRVGNKQPHYKGKERSFVLFSDGDAAHDIRALPCRYVPFIAVQSIGRPQIFGPMRSTGSDRARSFWVPIHKLFSGTQCIENLNLDLQWDMRHFNQKLAKFATYLREHGHSNLTDKELTSPPYVFEKGIANWANAIEWGEGVLFPSAQPLVKEATQQNNPVTFTSPPMPSKGFYNANSPTLSLKLFRGRSCPEYVHIRQKQNPAQDINLLPDVVDIANAGNYEALHYLDFSGDGWVKCEVSDRNTGVEIHYKNQPIDVISAFSIVAAPDFFPYVNQRQLYEWWLDAPKLAAEGKLPQWWVDLIDQQRWKRLWVGSPSPLSDERCAPNVQMPDAPFSIDDDTITAIVFVPRATEATITQESKPVSRFSYLPDAASDTFFPGWDVSYDEVKIENQNRKHLATYGLGSPFPEDAKLCAALSTFWPAASPDTNRTFFKVASRGGTVCPMTDEEMGIPSGTNAWDGVMGPHVVAEDAQGITVNYPDYPHADYTRNAIDNQFSVANVHKVTGGEYQDRILAMQRCYRALDEVRDIPGEYTYHLHIFSFTQVDATDAELKQAQSDTNGVLQGPVYRFKIFADRELLENGDIIDNVEGPEMVGNHHRALYRTQYWWTIFVGDGPVLMKLKLGDGSSKTGAWTSYEF
ncbi:hypothetical protein [Candidatus Uabimicrobium amorphum]|uniref:Uncharacterized protein n=1 Tax=Uabimicrobium amorphum TaxID=2596890 RepID=A0A5S9IIR9_UABAM|nr:hypothetical protein [Candidatus Uabimicrobium amorphum]BBM82151.1 hypothetical protein UABAM_00494 [Candidatus Uabimicrobium amorphum]